LKEALHDCYFPVLKDMLAIINRYAEEWKDIPMRGRLALFSLSIEIVCN
jgi:hypothetical protein